MISQEPVHRPIRHEMTDHRISIQKFTIRRRLTLHSHSLLHPHPNRETFHPSSFGGLLVLE